MATNDNESYPAFPGQGVLTRADNADYVQAVTNAVSTKDGLVVGMPGVSPVTFPTSDLTVDQTTGRLRFTSADTPYKIRELREDDGSWLSKYKTLLPLPSVGALIGSGFTGDYQMAAPNDDSSLGDETLDAFSTSDSPYIVGVLYTNAAGRYAREDGAWVLLAPDDDTFSDDDLATIQIDPDRADDFLDAYDQNYISVEDAAQYEDPNSPQDSEYTSDSDSSDLSNDQ